MFDPKPDHSYEIQHENDDATLTHEFSRPDILAIKAALAAERPLLLRGDPGVGKSQLARAAAVILKRTYVPFAVDAQTEVRDLRWQEDAVARLAKAQLVRALGDKVSEEDVEKRLHIGNFIVPGPLWWGINWSTAEKHAKASDAPVPKPPRDECSPSNGVVVLIDEIDKADTQVPNGLLEALGTREFQPNSAMPRVTVENVWPLIIVTTNNERRLPPAFLRRCVVHEIKLPPDEEDLKAQLVRRGRARFQDLDTVVLEQAADQTIKDRNSAAKARVRPLPGQAEYFDLLQAVSRLSKLGEQPRQIIKELSEFFLVKHASSGS